MKQKLIHLKQYLSQVLGGVRSYFDARKDAPLQAFEREASRHPVFRITVGEKPSRTNETSVE